MNNIYFILFNFKSKTMDLLSRLNQAYGSSSSSESENEDSNDDGNVLAKIQPKEMMKSSVPLSGTT